MRTYIRAFLLSAVACGLTLAQNVTVSDKPVHVKGSEQQAKIIKMVKPTYPPEAKAAGIQGLVKLEVTIGKDGTVSNIKALGGPEQLIPPAEDAVKQWQWEPTKVDGKPVEVMTEVNVNYELAKKEK